MSTVINFGTYKYNLRGGHIITLKQYKRMGGFIKGLTEIKNILLSEQTERLDDIMQVKKLVKLNFDLIKS
jgi:hypothetical protein